MKEIQKSQNSRKICTYIRNGELCSVYAAWVLWAVRKKYHALFCLTLNCLFHRSSWKKAVTFKGENSLSKGYHLISRFSEDIDLILDWRVLGYGINEPWENARTPSRMPSIKRRTERPRFSWQKPSARRSGKGFLLNWAFRPIFT